ncbi:MAG: sugar phosphate nucleotidyltransferase [bacterium]
MPFDILDTMRVLAIVLAGGSGTRIEPLVRRRAKAAIPFGATHRLIDVPLSNLLNSWIRHIYVIAQRLPHSLIQHLEGFQRAGVATMMDEFIRVLTPPHECSPFISDGDSLCHLRMVWQRKTYEYVLIIMADQVVKIDYRQVLQHLMQSKNAEAAIVYRKTPLAQAKGKLGVFDRSLDGRPVGFTEKPDKPNPSVDDSDNCDGNTAMTLLRYETFMDLLSYLESLNGGNKRFLSPSAIPWLIKRGKTVLYNLESNVVPGVLEAERAFFADVGDLDDWYNIQIAMCQRGAIFNPFSRDWTIYTAPIWPLNAAKVDHVGEMDQVLLGWNVIVQDNAMIRNSVLSSSVCVGHDSRLRQAVLLDGVQVGPGCRLNNVVLDKDIIVPEGTTLSPDNPPDIVINFSDLYAMVTDDQVVPDNLCVRSEGGILFFAKGYQFPGQ